MEEFAFTGNPLLLTWEIDFHLHTLTFCVVPRSKAHYIMYPNT